MVDAGGSVRYAERRSTRLPATVWTSARTGRVDPTTVLPDGCMDLLWDGRDLLVAGPDTKPSPVTTPARRYLAIRFDPGVAPDVLSVAADQVVDERPGLDAIWPARTVRRWRDAVGAADDPALTLERLAADLHDRSPSPGWVSGVAAALREGRSVEHAAAGVGFSARELRRRARGRFGYGAKLLQRILRVDAAAGEIGRGIDPTRAAIDLGYADYPHLHREARALLGRSPVSFRADQAGSGA